MKTKQKPKNATNPFGKLRLLPDVPEDATLYFNLKNAKLKDSPTAAFSIPAGYTCPGACDCLAWVDRETGKVQDGPDSKFRCFAASSEAAFKTVQKSVDKNYTLLKRAKTVEDMAELIEKSMPAKFYKFIRVHADGDFYHRDYFLAWMEVARRDPDRLFYAYTKSLPLWTKYKSFIPENFVLNASRGGKYDWMIEPHNLRNSVVVNHPEEAEKLGLQIDHTDEIARDPDVHQFALLLHGTQPAGSEASAALKRMKKEGVNYAYSLKK